MTTYVEHAQILVADLDRTERFYTRLFPDWSTRARGREISGRKFYNWLHVGSPRSYLSFRTAYDSGEPEVVPTVEIMSNHIGVVVDDMGATIERLEALGAQVIKSTHPHRLRVYTRDPDGYEVELIQYLTDDVDLRNDCSWCVENGISEIVGKA